MTVLEVLKPALQRGIEILNRHSQTLAIGAPGFLTDRVLHLLQTLLPRPTESPFEVISQEVEATRLGSIDNPCLFRMQRQARRSGPFLHPGQRLTRFLLAATQQHEVVRIPDHLHPALSHEMVQRMEIEIRQQGADHRTLRRALLRRPEFVRFHHRLLQECCDQVQHPTIGNILPHPRQHRRLRNRVEVAPQIRIHDPVIALIQELLDTTKCVFRTALWPKPITVFGELPLEDGFHHLPQSSLHHPVAHGGNPQRPRFAAPWFRNPHAANRLRLVRARPQLFRNLIQVLFQAFFKILHRHSIHSRRAAVGFHFSESALQIGGVPHLINQTEPTPPFHPQFEAVPNPPPPPRAPVAFPFRKAVWRLAGFHTLLIRLNQPPPFTPSSRAVNIRSLHTDGSVHVQRTRTSPACLANFGTFVGCCSIVVSLTNPPPCVPLLQTRYGPSWLLRTL